MQIWKTSQEKLSAADILKYIAQYEREQVPHLTNLWDYYIAQNPTIRKKKAPDANNPDNRTKVSYGRKIVKTFAGYAYRPHYISYKVVDDNTFAEWLKSVYAQNTEYIKTSRAGRNTGVFGVAYEIVYIDPDTAKPRFFSVDPREMILLYDFSPEPQKVAGIRFLKMTANLYRVEVYYADRVETYERYRAEEDSVNDKGWKLRPVETKQHFFGAVPVVPYYLGDEMIGVIDPVLDLIDDYDLLVSDSLNEFDRFAHAYLILKKMSLVNPQLKKDAKSYSSALKLLKRRRVIENVPENGDVSFLTKDIATAFIEFMIGTVREEIHKQSHVPDFMSEKLGGDLSGVAVQRLMFDFENLVSAAEGDFDVGLNQRLDLLKAIYTKTADAEEITVIISHRRNTPVNVKEFADIALVLKNAGFSRQTIAEAMPDDIVPDPQAEIDRQDEDRVAVFGDLESGDPTRDAPDPLEGGDAPTADVQKQALNGAQTSSMIEIVEGVVLGTLPPASSKQILLVAIPSMSSDQADAIIDPAVDFTPPAPAAAPNPFENDKETE